MGREPGKGDKAGWYVLEAIAPDKKPRFIFELGSVRTFSERRHSWRSNDGNQAFDRVVEAAQLTGEEASDWAWLDKHTKLVMKAFPVFGPHNDVYGVEVAVAVGEELNPATRQVRPGTTLSTVVDSRRVVRGYSYDIDNQLTHHGPGVDEDILCIDPLSAVRPPQTIFSFYDDFPKLGELDQFNTAAQAGTLDVGTEFQADICLTDGFGRGRTIQVSQRYTVSPAGTPQLQGILHDVTDIPGHEHKIDPGKQGMRYLAAQADDSVGLGEVALTSGTLTSWVKPPPPSLDVWQYENPVFTERGAQVEANIRERVVQNKAEYSEFQADLWFPQHGVCATALIGYRFTGQSQGLMTVRLVT